MIFNQMAVDNSTLIEIVAYMNLCKSKADDQNKQNKNKKETKEEVVELAKVKANNQKPQGMMMSVQPMDAINGLTAA